MAAVAYCDYEANEEQLLFLQILHHDSRGGNIIRMEKREDWEAPRHTASKSPKNLLASRGGSELFATVNTFRGKRRVSSAIFNYENIVVDIDMHHGGNPIDIYDVLLEKYSAGTLLTPTMITFTGRGLCVVYSFKRSIIGKRGARLLDATRNLLFTAYEKELDGYGCDIDRSVADNARVIRLPGTINQKNGEFCRLLCVFKDEGEIHYVDLRTLADALGYEKKAKPKTTKKKKKKSKAKKPAQNKDKNEQTNSNTNFAKNRLKKLNQLIDMRNQADITECYRENILFIAYSTVKPIMPLDDAREYVRSMNQRFLVPLSLREVEGIFKPTDNVCNVKGKGGYYFLTDKVIMDKLGITDDENRILGFCPEGKYISRQKAKEATKQKRSARDEKIADLVCDGFSYKEIADVVGCSESTVRRSDNIRRSENKIVSINEYKSKNDKKNDKATRNEMIVSLFCDGLSYQEIANEVGCSLSTVKRVLKNENLTRYNKSETKAKIVAIGKPSKDDESVKSVKIVKNCLCCCSDEFGAERRTDRRSVAEPEQAKRGGTNFFITERTQQLDTAVIDLRSNGGTAVTECLSSADVTFAVIRDTVQTCDCKAMDEKEIMEIDVGCDCGAERGCNDVIRSEKDYRSMVYYEDENLWNDEGIDEYLSYDQYCSGRRTAKDVKDDSVDLWAEDDTAEDEIDYSDPEYWDTDGLDEQLEFYRRFYGYKSCNDKDDSDDSHCSDNPCNSVDHDNDIFRNDVPYRDDTPFENWFLTSKDINYDEIYI